MDLESVLSGTVLNELASTVLAGLKTGKAQEWTSSGWHRLYA